MKKVVSFILICCMAVAVFSFMGCKSDSPAEEITLKVGVLKEGDHFAAYDAVKSGFEQAYASENLKVEYVYTSYLENAVRPMLDNGEAPDVMILPTGRSDGLVEELIAQRSIINLDGLLDKNVYNEEIKLKDKFINGFLDTVGTNPYQDSLKPETSTYMLPLFYDVEGIIYNKKLFNQAGTDGKMKLPVTFDNFLGLRKTVADITGDDTTYLYGYGNASKQESFITATIASHAGLKIAEQMLMYETVYDHAQVVNALANLDKINKTYTLPASAADFVYPPSMESSANIVQNQKALIEDKVWFMPGGTDFITEMDSELKAAENFELGFTAPFGAGTDAQRYVGVKMSQAYILNHTSKLDAAEKFMLYLFSDESIKELTKGMGRVTPTINGVQIAKDNGLAGDKLEMLNVFDGSGFRPIYTSFARTSNVEVSWPDNYAYGLNNVFKGTDNLESWIAQLKTSSQKLRSSLIS